jgi:hypothetical protein
LRIVKDDKGTAGTMVAPAGEFKPRTSAKVRSRVRDEYLYRACRSRNRNRDRQHRAAGAVLARHPADPPSRRCSAHERRTAALGEDIRKHGLTSSIVLWSENHRHLLTAVAARRPEIAIGPAIVGAPSLIAGKDFRLNR